MSSDDALMSRGFAPAKLIVGVRISLLVACGVLAVFDTEVTTSEVVITLALLTVIAIAASLPLRNPLLARLQPVGEATLAAVVIAVPFQLSEAFLPYLLAPALAAGLSAGFATAVTTAGLAGLVLILARVFGLQSLPLSDYMTLITQWALITLAVGLLAAWVRRIQGSVRQDTENASYASAYRLLSQLRVVSRQLSGGLDANSLAHSLLETLQEQLRFDQAALFVRSPGGVLVPLAYEGCDRVEWDTSLESDSPLTEAWSSEAPSQLSAPLSPDYVGHAAVLPMRVGVRTFGLIGVERSSPFAAEELAGSMAVVEETGLRLETALLFSEVRSIATAEERRRVAREIHDGIAQELASLGYVIDDLAASAEGQPDLQESLRGLRRELTRVITELRLSIFDLRSEVQASVGLGTALSDYVRQVGAGSNLTVHLVLDEAPQRLRVETEAELLRIAQEAITNARKHAEARNLWVTCRVDPPSALLRVADDGVGLKAGREDSFGLEIMRERAARIGALLAVTNRDEGGTVIELALGDSAKVAGDDRPAA